MQCRIISSGSSAARPANDAGLIARQKVTVGKVNVLIPVGNDEHEPTQLEDGSWVFECEGRQVLCTEVHDLFAALRITKVQSGSVGDWSYRYGSNGNSVVYIAAHKSVPNVFVQGTTGSEEKLKEVLKLVAVVKPREPKPVDALREPESKR